MAVGAANWYGCLFNAPEILWASKWCVHASVWAVLSCWALLARLSCGGVFILVFTSSAGSGLRELSGGALVALGA